MRYCFLALIFLVITPVKGRDTLAIVRFSDTSNDQAYKLDKGQSSSLIQSLMENLTVRLSSLYRIVERKKMDAFFDELELSESGFISEENALQMGRMTGAQYILTGSITEAATTSISTTAYGSNARRNIYRLVLVFKLLHIESSEVIFGGEVEVSTQYLFTKGGGKIESDVYRKLSRKAADEVKNKLAAYLKQKKESDASNEAGKLKRTFEFKLSGKPLGAKVDIDGFYEGSLPLTIELERGVHKIKVYSSGFLASEISVKANKARMIEFDLKEEDSE